MNGHCNQCGMCCKALWLAYTPEELKHNNSPDAKFALEHFHRISKLVARLINPDLFISNQGCYYSCDLVMDNKCSLYEGRPYTCSGYPLYTDSYISPYERFYAKTCGFNPFNYKSGLLLKSMRLKCSKEGTPK